MDIIFDPQMTIGDMNALYEFVRTIRPEVVIEVGSWKGLSTWILAHHSDAIYCIDTWKAADSTPVMQEEAAGRDIFSLFRQNMAQLRIWDRIKPMMMRSEEAAKIIAGHCADLIFIDADHIYDSVYNDILLWKGKVKFGGILCGHDCDILWRDCPDHMKHGIENNLNIDYIQHAIEPGRGIHPGVTMAIHDIFDDQVNILPNSSIWWVRV